MNPPENSNLVRIGQVLKPHGLNGEVKVGLHLPGNLELDDLLELGIFLDQDSYEIEDAFWMNKVAVLCLAGIDSFEKAELLKDKILFLSRETIGKLKHNEYYLEDLLGLEVYDWEKQTLIGNVKDFDDIPGNPLLKIQTQDLKTFLLPFNEEFVIKIDLEKKKVFLQNWEDFVV